MGGSGKCCHQKLCQADTGRRTASQAEQNQRREPASKLQADEPLGRRKGVIMRTPQTPNTRRSAFGHIYHHMDLGRLIWSNHLPLRKVMSKTSKRVELSREVMVLSLLCKWLPVSLPLEPWLPAGPARCPGGAVRGKGWACLSSTDSHAF